MIEFLAVRPIMWLRVNPQPPDRDERMRHTRFAEISMRSLARLAGRFGLLAILGISLAGCGVNSIPSQEEAAKAKWSQVLNQYQRRADLIPNLVETVKGYAKQEAQVLEAVVAARARATSVQVPPDILTNPEAFKKFQEAQSEMTSALSRLLVVSENYPQLKSDQNFRDLQAQLEGTENRITVARKRYIDSVQQYNTTVRQFPVNLTAMMFGYKDKPNFTVENEAAIAKPPTVDFNKPAPAPAPQQPAKQ